MVIFPSIMNADPSGKLGRFTLLAALFLGVISVSVAAQVPTGASEVSEADGTPVILLHLPKYETVKERALFINSRERLTAAAGERPSLASVDLSAGTEAAFAPYDEGKLVIVEFTNPQASVELDGVVGQMIAAGGDPTLTAYRRVGNYNVFVYDGNDPIAAGALIDQIKYEKFVQWLGEDPYLLKRFERYMAATTRDIMISTVQVIVFGLLGSILTGFAVGIIYFRVRDQRRSAQAAFSDAGGLTRLNLDELTVPVDARQLKA